MGSAALFRLDGRIGLAEPDRLHADATEVTVLSQWDGNQ
jgi:hypothetical protein